MRLLFMIGLLLLVQTARAQKSFTHLLHHKNFSWSADSSQTAITIYYQQNSWASGRITAIRQQMLDQINAVKSFLQIGSYPPRIHLFVVETRQQMKSLIGWETNGTAFYKYQTLTGIASAQLNSIRSNHELFHLMATNLWGVPATWLNEGMAVYADGYWYGYDLYQLSHYLIDQDRYISLERLIKEFRKIDDLISYPLIGSFTKYLEQTYGRDMVICIWKGNPNQLQAQTGKRLEVLEAEWLTKVKATPYQNIQYPKS